MSASMVILKDGSLYRKLSHEVTLPVGFKLEEGCSLSWEYQILHPKCEMENIIFLHGKSKIFFKPVMGSLIVRIECPDIKDFLEAIELVILYAGGKVETLDSCQANQSFIAGIKNDLIWLGQRIANLFRSIRQRIGLAIAK